MVKVRQSNSRGADMRNRTDDRRAKLASGVFTWDDLDGVVQEMVPRGTKVTPLKVGVWTRIGDLWLLNREVSHNPDDTFVRITKRPHRSWLSRLALPFVRDKGEWVVCWATMVPGTDILISFWYVGDGTGNGMALAVQKG